MRILVDDEPDIRAVLSEWLSGQGYQVRPLNDESEVLTFLSRAAMTWSSSISLAQSQRLVAHLPHSVLLN